MIYKKDTFGNELNIGDTVITSLPIFGNIYYRKGVITKESKKVIEKVNDELVEVQKFEIVFHEFSKTMNPMHIVKKSVIKCINLIKM